MDTVLEVVSGGTILISCIMIIWRMLSKAGVKLKKRIEKDTVRESYIPTRREEIKVFLYSTLFRVFVLIVGFMISCIFIDSGSEFQKNQIYEIWNKWDAPHYLNISKGYMHYTENGDYTTLVFYPLYPLLVSLVNMIIPNLKVAALITSTICTSIACVFLYKLVCEDYGKSIAKKTLILMNIFPFSFFFGAIMSEGTFLMTSVITLYYIHKHDWMKAGIAGLFAALSRALGVFLIFSATIEFVEEYKLLENLKNIKPKLILILKKWTWLLLIPLGTCIYLFINYKITGDALYFAKMEKKYWHEETQIFFKTVGDLWNFINGDVSVSWKMTSFVPGLALLLASYALLIYGIPRHKNMYSIWIVCSLIINSSMTLPQGIPRYLSTVVPLYIILADISEKNEKVYTALKVSFSILFGVYLTAYLMYKYVL